MPKPRQSKSSVKSAVKSSVKSAVKSVSIRFPSGDLALLKKAAKADNRSLQKYALVYLVECAKKTLQVKLPLSD